MKNYELTFLISPSLQEKELKLLEEKIVSLIQEKGGVLISNMPPLKKNLFYPIKKFEEAFLAVVNFQLKPENLADFEKKLKAEENILRYLLLTKKVFKKEAPPQRKEKRIPKKVEIKNIEEKLKEILNEI